MITKFPRFRTAHALNDRAPRAYAPTYSTSRLVQPFWFAHGRLDVQDLDVLPILLEERHQEVDRELEVLDELLLGHPDVPRRHVQAEHLLQLELLEQ